LRKRAPGEIGSVLVSLPEVDSTSAEALRRIDSDQAPHGLVILADRQTDGRGRGENKWFSPAGTGLWFSVVLDLSLASDRLSLLTQVAGLSLCRALEAVPGVKPRVKWPNDLHLEGRKVAGILTEARTRPDGGTTAVLGVGLNVNQRHNDFPEALQATATSLRIVTGEIQDRASVLYALLDGLQEGVARLADGSLIEMDEALRFRSAVLGKRVRVCEGGIEREGTVTVQSLTGGITIRAEDGEFQYRGEYIQSLDLLE